MVIRPEDHALRTHRQPARAPPVKLERFGNAFLYDDVHAVSRYVPSQRVCRMPLLLASVAGMRGDRSARIRHADANFTMADIFRGKR